MVEVASTAKAQVIMSKTVENPRLSALTATSYYGHLRSPIFFLTSALSTIPLLVGYDNEWRRDLFRDLGPVHRWQCSKHCLPKAKSTASFFSLFYISFQTYLSLCQHDYASHSFLSSCLHSHISMIMFPPPLCNHAYYYMSFLLTLTDIAFSAALSLCTAS